MKLKPWVKILIAYILLLFLLILSGIFQNTILIHIVITYFLLLICSIPYYPFIFDPPKKEKNTLFYWMDDSLRNERLDLLLKQKNVKKDALANLNYIHKEIINYANNDNFQLKLLKAYYKTKNSESTIDVYNKTLLAFIIGILIASIASGKFVDFIKLLINSDTVLVSKTYLYGLIGVICFIHILILVIQIISTSHKGKRRNKLIEEIIDISLK